MDHLFASDENTGSILLITQNKLPHSPAGALCTQQFLGSSRAEAYV